MSQCENGVRSHCAAGELWLLIVSRCTDEASAYVGPDFYRGWRQVYWKKVSTGEEHEILQSSRLL